LLLKVEVPVGFVNAREFRQCPFKGSASMRAELPITEALYVPIKKGSCSPETLAMGMPLDGVEQQ
jgi:hypothetical protein